VKAKRKIWKISHKENWNKAVQKKLLNCWWKNQCSRLTSHDVNKISQNLDVISNLKHFRYETVCVIKIYNFIPFHTRIPSLPSERYFSRKLSEVTFIGRSYKPILVLPNRQAAILTRIEATSVNPNRLDKCDIHSYAVIQSPTKRIHDWSSNNVVPLVCQPSSADDVQREHSLEPEGLSLAAAGGVSRVPATKVHKMRCWM